MAVGVRRTNEEEFGRLYRIAGRRLSSSIMAAIRVTAAAATRSSIVAGRAADEDVG